MTNRGMRKQLIKSIPIETKRVILRYITLSDAYDMYEYASRPQVSKYLLWDPHINVAATEGYIESLQKRYKKGLYADWAVVLKENNKMIGTCGYSSFDSKDKTCEIGYVLSPDYQKHGIMYETVNAVLHLTFDVLELKEARLRIIAENTASRRLAERLGFEMDRIVDAEMFIKGRYCDIVHYKMTKDDYMIKKEAVV